LKEEKQQLESEVDKWGDNTSDLIVVAKDMGMMLVEMSDFTRLSHSPFYGCNSV
jgi:hypothetical protein